MTTRSDDMGVGVGLSVGATTLAAVMAGRHAVLRTPVLTFYPGRQPEIGVPSENKNLFEPGLVVAGFVDRVGDPIGIVAADGSVHRGEAVLAEALRVLTFALTGGRWPAAPVVVTFPSHWRPTAVEALRGALLTVPGFSGGTRPVSLIPDADAAVAALQAQPGLPTRGVVALCDFGGSGTSLTLVDAANGYRPIGPTVRHADFSGDLIDQALLAHVISDVSTGGVDLSSTSAFGSLSRLRRQCRAAKEQLSATSVTTLPAELPGYRGEIRVTRKELDNEIRTPLTEFIGVVRDTMERNGIRAAGLVAVASVGGGARIPAITTTLSEHLRVPVVTDAQPELTAATGALIRAGRGPEDDSRTTLAAATPAGLAAGAYSGDAVDSASTPSLAWSEVDEAEEVTPTERYDYAGGADVPTDAARPQVQFDHGQMADGEAEPAPPWYRRPAVIVAGALLGVLAVVTAVAVVMVRMVGGVDTVSGLGEVFLEPSSAAGADPFSPPVATPQPPATNPGADPAGAPSDGGVRTTSGELPGLYGGTRNLTTCEPETLIAFLAENPDKARAWAGVFGITPEQIPAFVRELTPVLLRTDTRVTNHGFANGQASPRQSVLEAGTAVLVDKSGSPRVRCYCGNPLLDPVATSVAPVYTGPQWSKFAADTIVVVRPAPRVIDTFVVYDPTTGTYFGRPRGGTGPTDIDDPRALTLKTTQPPAAPPPPPPRTRTTVYEAPPPVTRTHTLAPATPPITEVAPTTEVVPTTTEVPTMTTEPWPTLTWLPPITDFYPPPEHPETQYAPAPEEPLVPTTTIPMDPHGGY